MGRGFCAADIQAAVHVRPLVELVTVVPMSEKADRIARHGVLLLRPHRVHVGQIVLGGVAEYANKLVYRLGASLFERQAGNGVVHEADQGELGAVAARLVVPAP